jgi:hypothetical protein
MLRRQGGFMDGRRMLSGLRILLVAAPLLACSPVSGRSWGGSGTVRLDVADGWLEVSLRPDRGGPLRLRPDGPHRWTFDGPTSNLVGESYSVVLRNRTDERLKVVVGVDGLNVYAREEIAGSAHQDVGSILSAWSDRTLPGWQLDLDRAQRFVFSPPEWSEGEGRTEAQIGLLSVQVYREWQPEPWGYEKGYRDGEERGTLEKAPAPVPSERQEDAAAASPRARNAPIGTTSGDDVDSSVRTVRFVAATAYPEVWAMSDDGRAERAWHPREPRGDDLLGLWVEPDADGTRIVSVAPGSAADRAGLEPADVIVRIDTVYGPSPSATRRILRQKDPGDYAFLRVRRGPHELAVKIRT